MTIETITCCKSTYLVGIDGRSLDRMETGCELRGAIAVGSDDLARAPRVAQRAPCPRCGRLAVVQTSHPTRSFTGAVNNAPSVEERP
jgi:hypothetical protein